MLRCADTRLSGHRQDVQKPERQAACKRAVLPGRLTVEPELAVVHAVAPAHPRAGQHSCGNQADQPAAAPAWTHADCAVAKRLDTGVRSSCRRNPRGSPHLVAHVLDPHARHGPHVLHGGRTQGLEADEQLGCRPSYCPQGCTAWHCVLVCKAWPACFLRMMGTAVCGTGQERIRAVQTEGGPEKRPPTCLLRMGTRKPWMPWLVPPISSCANTTAHCERGSWKGGRRQAAFGRRRQAVCE